MRGFLPGQIPACRGGFVYDRRTAGLGRRKYAVLWGAGDTEPRGRVWQFDVEVEEGGEWDSY